jgi:glycerol uptake facilitator-like aquaporin
MQVRGLLLRYSLLLRTSKALFAEFFGTAVLVAAVIGSGIMAQSLTSDRALQLLINALSTILALGVLIWLFTEVSGAHFNPVVSIAAAIRKDLSPLHMVGFVIAQFVGGLAGTALANAMFAHHLIEVSHHHRSGHALLLGEVVATCGLVLVIFSKVSSSRLMYLLVPAWIGSAYFFTSSTSFANPAVTLARVWSNSFAGIAPASLLPFIGAELFGGALGLAFIFLLFGQRERKRHSG